MIQLPDGIQIHLWTRPCDMRRGFDVLAQEAKHSSPEHDKAALVMIAELYRLEREFKDKLKEDKGPVEKCRPAAFLGPDSADAESK